MLFAENHIFYITSLNTFDGNNVSVAILKLKCVGSRDFRAFGCTTLQRTIPTYHGRYTWVADPSHGKARAGAILLKCMNRQCSAWGIVRRN